MRGSGRFGHFDVNTQADKVSARRSSRSSLPSFCVAVP